MDALEGLNNEIKQLLSKLDDEDLFIIQNYLIDKNLSLKYISCLKNECNNMQPQEALFYLFETAKKQVFLTKKVKGIKGLATLLKVSLKTPQKLKNSGIIDETIIYEQSKLYFDEKKCSKFACQKNNIGNLLN